MNLNQLYYFKTVAKVEHFRYAAELLSISQPSLSYAISSLEEELGIALFEKKGRNIVLTKYGKIFLSYVEEALDMLESGQKKIKQLTSPVAGHIDLAYVAPLAFSYIPTMVRKFLDVKAHGEITFSFKQGITGDIIEGLKSSKYDVGFCSYVENEKDIVFEPIIEQELVVVVQENHPLATRDEMPLADIAPYPIVAYDKHSGLGKALAKLFRAAQITPQVVCEGEDENAILGLVLQHFGIAVVAKTEALDHLPLKAIHITSPQYHRQIFMAHMKNTQLAPVVQNFIAYIKNNS